MLYLISTRCCTSIYCEVIFRLFFFILATFFASASSFIRPASGVSSCFLTSACSVLWSFRITFSSFFRNFDVGDVFWDLMFSFLVLAASELSCYAPELWVLNSILTSLLSFNGVFSFAKLNFWVSKLMNCWLFIVSNSLLIALSDD